MSRVYKSALVVLLIFVAALSGGVVSNMVQAAGIHPVGIVLYPDSGFSDGAHWIVKLSFRGIDRFVDLGDSCPTSQGEAANLLSRGVAANRWTVPDPNFPRNWKLTRGSAIELDQPGFGTLDVWIQGGPRSITTPGPISEAQDEATFKCGGSGLQQVFLPAASRNDPPPPPPSGNLARCPTSPSDAAALLSSNQGAWDDLGTQPWDGFQKWKFTSPTPVDLSYHGFGSYDYWKLGNGLRQAIPQADTVTFNCDG